MPTTPNYFCDVCNKDGKTRAGFIAHQKSKIHLMKTGLITDQNSKLCEKCNQVFLLLGYEKHYDNCKGKVRQTCNECGKVFTTITGLNNHIKTEHNPNKEISNILINNKEKTISDIYYTEQLGERDDNPITGLEGYIDRNSHLIIESLSKAIDKYKYIKYSLSLNLTFSQYGDQTNPLTIEIQTSYRNLFTKVDKTEINDINLEIQTEYEQTKESLNPSNLILDSINFIKMSYFEIDPFSASSYIPTSIKSKHLINPQNTDQKCFMWCILAALHPVEHNPQRVTNYQEYVNTLNFKDMLFPFRLADLKRFESLNNLRINVYGLMQPDIKKVEEEKLQNKKPKIHPLYISKSTLPEVISLLLISEDNEANYHYILIKNFQSFSSEQFRKNNHTTYFHTCERCFQHTTSESMRIKHERLCQKNEPAVMKMPKKYTDKNGKVIDQTKMKFKKYSAFQKTLATVYGDFECTNLKPHYNAKNSIRNQYMNILNKNPKLKEEYENFNYVRNIHTDLEFKLKTFFDAIDHPWTIQLCEQVSSSYKLFIKSNYPEIFQDFTLFFRGESKEEVLKKYIQDIDNTNDFLTNLIKENERELTMTDEDNQHFQNTNICWLCETEIYHKNKVRDHDHFTGKYRGPAHSDCNIQCKKPTRIPVVFQNGSNYDNHLFMKALAEHGKHNKIEVLGKTTEEYLSVRYGCLNFIDSYRFFGMSLEAVANSLQDSDFKNLQAWLKSTTISYPYLFQLCREKGIFPYDYVDSFEKYKETKLPIKERFYSILVQQGITDEEYERAKKIWEVFECKTLGDYNDIYLKMDVYILADCFETFIKNFKLNPCHYVSAPSLAWDVLLSESKMELELLTDLEMFLLIKNNIRGGISSVMGKRHLKAHNYKILEEKIPEYKEWRKIQKKQKPAFLIKDTTSGKALFNMTEFYKQATSKKGARITTKDYVEITDPKEFEYICKSFNNPDWILYIDATALYSGIMTLFMPYKDFKWEEVNDDIINKILNTPKDSKTGYFVECDLEYPDNIKEETKHFPLAPLKRRVEYNELLDYQIERKTDKNPSTEKLICDQNNKTYYLCHYLNLQYYVKMGMKLTKVHSIISFKQKPWMKDYIENNIRKRNENKDLEFLVTIFKLLNNAVFGKTMENLDKRRNIKLCTSREIDKIKKVVSRPTFKGSKTFSKDLICLEIGNYEKLYNKPIYLGFTILELSKLQMYQTYYDVLTPKFKDRISLHAMDTDSNFLLIKSPDVYKELDDLKNLINNSKQLFTYKDENDQDVMTEFNIIRAKQYAFNTLYEKKKAKERIKLKGVQSKLIENGNITIQNYRDCLSNDEKQFVILHSIQRKNHKISLTEGKKLAFYSFDDKRAILSDGIHTLPYGHHKLPFIQSIGRLNKVFNLNLNDVEIYQMNDSDFFKLCEECSMKIKEYIKKHKH